MKKIKIEKIKIFGNQNIKMIYLYNLMSNSIQKEAKD